VCTYLIDVWCLGVKNTIPPRKVERVEYNQLIEQIYEGFPEGIIEITLPQAQGIVYSAVEYAEQLGFTPHRDFEKSRVHLGEWNGEHRIQCGKDGKPFYMSGPYDNPEKVIRTLVNSVGEGNFNYMIGIESL
jgi:hypothetical protein